MQAAVREWITNITMIAILGALVDIILPGSSFRKYTKFLFGLVILILFLRPITRLLDPAYDFESEIFRNALVQNTEATAFQSSRMEEEQKQRLEQLLRDFDLTDLKDQRGYQLSGGERRRTEIARALALQPGYLLLDEPFSGVDPIAVAAIQELIIKLKRNGIGVLITDHNVRETLSIVDRAYIMHNGKILTSGTAAELAADPIARRYYLGDSFHF